MARIETEHQKLCRKFKEFVYGRAKSLKKSHSKIAKNMGLSQQCFSYKLRNLTFDVGELMELLDELEVTGDELPELLMTERQICTK